MANSKRRRRLTYQKQSTQDEATRPQDNTAAAVAAASILNTSATSACRDRSFVSSSFVSRPSCRSSDLYHLDEVELDIYRRISAAHDSSSYDPSYNRNFLLLPSVLILPLSQKEEEKRRDSTPPLIMDTNMEDVGRAPAELAPVPASEPATIPTLDGWIESLMNCKQLAEADVQRLCEKVGDLLVTLDVAHYLSLSVAL